MILQEIKSDQILATIAKVDTVDVLPQSEALRLMLRTVAVVLFFLGMAAPVCEAQFDDGFQDRAMAHVRHLASLTNRVAGSPAESKAIAYIRDEFLRVGLPAATEPFRFRSFELAKASLRASGRKFAVTKVVFDPYASHRSMLNRSVVFVAPETIDNHLEFFRLKLKDKLVVTREPANPYRIRRKLPIAIAFVSASDFDALRALQPQTASIDVLGNQVLLKSANVVATLPSTTQSRDFVIVSAHLDSVYSPGADDNASGVAALIEIARYFGSLKVRPLGLKFVAFGAEEVGMLGAKAYLARHLNELRACVLVFNMDSIGGPGKLHAEMRDGVEGIAGVAVNQIPRDIMHRAIYDLNSRWLYIPDSLPSASNVPGWLQDSLRFSAKELEIELVQSRDMGSDHEVFAQAGIVATNIAVTGGNIHTPEDVAERVVSSSLVKASRLVVNVVTNASIVHRQP